MKKIGWVMLGISLTLLGWYLFIRPFEFEVNFKAQTLPGDIIQTIRIWNRSLANAEIAQVDSVYGLTQHIDHEGRQYIYHWNFEMVNDSTTHVNVKITQPARRLRNKLLVPFTDEQIEYDAEKIAKQFYGVLQTHLRITDVKIIGEGEIESSFCVCRNLQTSQIEKAYGMMKDYGLITSFINDSNLKPNGPPIVRVREWSHTNGKLNYDFCFPIVKTDLLPVSDSVTYQELKKEKVLQAVYHGNYITSDRAWYELINFAQTNGYEINGLPIEYFHNNPNLGINEKEWKAEVYLPVK